MSIEVPIPGVQEVKKIRIIVPPEDPDKVRERDEGTKKDIIIPRGRDNFSGETSVGRKTGRRPTDEFNK
jgi:hypothetical protein